MSLPKKVYEICLHFSQENYTLTLTYGDIKEMGNEIIVPTYENTNKKYYSLNIALINLLYLITLYQLKKWKVKFNKIYFGKPSSDLYIDDKNLNFKSNWVNQLKKQLKI